MLKRYTVIFFLFLAYALVLGHSIIPHHHHDEDHHEQQASHCHDQDDGDEDDMEHAFSGYSHAAGADNFHQPPSTKSSIKQIASAYLLSVFIVSLQTIENPPPVASRAEDHVPICLLSFSTEGLRAPPTLLA